MNAFHFKRGRVTLGSVTSPLKLMVNTDSVTAGYVFKSEVSELPVLPSVTVIGEYER